MLEVMLTGSNVTVVPNSGPGNKKLLAGNKTNGWFGVIDGNTMISTAELLDKLGRPSLPLANATAQVGWLKAMLNGKPVFVASNALYATTWINIYNQGWMLGTDEKPYVPYGATASTQIVIIDYTDRDGKTWFFKVRTIRGTNNYITTGSGSNLIDSEHGLLYSKITNGQSQVDGTPNWDKLTQGTHYQNVEWMTSSVSSNYNTTNGNYIGRTYTPSGGATWRAYTYTSNWVPLLEVINPDDELLPPVNIFADPYIVSGANAVGSTDSESLTPGVITQLSTDERGANVTSVVDGFDKVVPATLVYLATDELPALFSQ